MQLLLLFVIYLMVSYGVTLIITQGTIFEGLRNFLHKYNPNFLGMLVSCVMCAGFWVGIFVSIFLNPVFPFIINFIAINNLLILKTISFIISIIFCGGLASGFCWLIQTIVDYLQTKTSLAELEMKNITYELLKDVSENEASEFKNGILYDVLENYTNS